MSTPPGSKWAIPEPLASQLGYDAYVSWPDDRGWTVRLWRGDRTVTVHVPTEVVDDHRADLWAEITRLASLEHRRRHDADWRGSQQTPAPL